MTDLVDSRGEAPAGVPTDSEIDASTGTAPDVDSAVEQIRNRAERVRQQELDAALRRLEARGEVTPEQRRVVAALSADIADALAERWTAALDPDAGSAEVPDADIDPAVARNLFTE